MERNEYVVLRSSAPAPDLGEVFSGRVFNVRGINATLANAKPYVSVETLSKRDIADLRQDPKVVRIAHNMPISLVHPATKAEVATSTQAGATWGVITTRAAESHFIGSGITVAILDTGIDAQHEAFQGVELVQSDFTGEGNGDGNGHGTHVAGTVFGQVINGYRFGVAPGIKRALIGKVLDSQGGGTTAGVVEAVQWAAREGAHIISMSLGFSFPLYAKQLIDQGIPKELAADKALQGYRTNVRLFDSLVDLMFAQAAFSQGALIVAAAGNESQREINPDYELAVAPPAAADGVISVGALATAGEPHDALRVADFSNTGPNLAGPGVDIYSAKAGGGYMSISGTSMATPHVAGVAALWAEKLLAASGRINITELSSLLVGGAVKNRLAEGFDHLDIGAGLVQAPLE